MINYTEHRKDGWPLCPVCGEDELWSGFNWNGDGEPPPMQAWIDHGLRCYLCGFDSQQESRRDLESFYREHRDRTLRMLTRIARP
jgi:uncharacterized protein (DUF983 family)